MTDTPLQLATLAARTALHAPIKGEPTAPPIPQTTAWAFRSLEDADAAWSTDGGRELYARIGTPLHGAIEKSLCALEGTESALLFSTGMAAVIACIDHLCPPGSTLLASQDLYGTTDTYLDGLLKERNVTTVRVDCSDLEALKVALANKPAALVMEVLTNPTLRVLRLDRVAQLAHSAGTKVIVDATFTPPVLMRTAALGADLVVHSASKSLAGHGDVSAGVVSGPAALIEKMRSRRTITGAHLGAMEAYLLARGMRTLQQRVNQSCLNALHLAQRLESQRLKGKLPQVARVVHPSLPGHPEGVWFAQNAHGQFGMLFCLDLAGGGTAAATFVRSLTDIRLVPSLGDLCTSVAVPARSSHRGLAPAERARRGITDGFIRVSVGIEDAADLARDIEHALKSMT